MTPEIKQEILEFANWINGRTAEHHSKEIIGKLFRYHSILFPKHQEYKPNCTSCRKKVYLQLIDWANKQNNTNLDNQADLGGDTSNCCKSK